LDAQRPLSRVLGIMILIAFRQGLRMSKLCDLQWSSIEFETATMHVRRAKGGQEATHPLLGDELRALRELKRRWNYACRGEPYSHTRPASNFRPVFFPVRLFCG
jgi:integrase